MNRYLCVALVVFTFLPGAFAQDPLVSPVPGQAPPPFAQGGLAQGQPPGTQAAQPATTTIKLLVVLSRYEGEKKISSFPYMLSLVPGRSGTIRSGAEVPVPTTSFTSAADKEKGATTAYTLQQVGAQIDATVTPTSDGKYNLRMNVTDRSVRPPNPGDQTRVPNVPTFKNVSSSSEAIMSSGETIQFISSADQVANETFKVDVTLTVGNK